MPDEPEYATGGLIPGPKSDDPPFYRMVDSCMLGRFLADVAPEAGTTLRLPQDPTWTVTTDPDGTVHLSRSRGKQYEEDGDD